MELKIPIMGVPVRTPNAPIEEFLVEWMMLRGAGAGEKVRAKPPVGDEPWGQPPHAWGQPGHSAMGQFSPLVHNGI